MIALILVFIDQLIKEFAIKNLELGTSYPVIDGLLWLRLAYNDAAAFSLGFGHTWILAVFASIAGLVTIWYGLKMNSLSWQIMTGLFLAGVVGNLVDRLTREPSFGNGYVIDYIQIPFNFPIFNLADMLIVCMVSLTVIRVFRGESIGGLPPKQK